MMSEPLVYKRYKLIRVIGEGGMGKVWLADDTHTGQQIALKEIHPELVTRSPEYLKRFEREAELLRQLNHPNIISMLEFFEEDKRRYLAMPYLVDGSLAGLLIRDGMLSVGRVRRLGLDLCDALTRAHRLGVVHRDLKPDNILLDEEGSPVLTDFGVARLKTGTALTKEGALVGSIGYVSPEVCQGKEANERSDIWSLGVVFYEMLTGVMPFQRDTVSATLMAILQDPMPSLDNLRPDIPFEMVMLLRDMLAKDPAFRIDSVRQVAAALERVPDVATPRPDVPVARPLLDMSTDLDSPGHAPAHTPTSHTGLSDAIDATSSTREVAGTSKEAMKTLVKADLLMARRYGPAVLFGGVLVLLAVLFVLWQGGVPGAQRQAETPFSPTALPVPTLEPLDPHQRLLLVADFENLGGDELAVGRVVADQLDRAYRILPSLQPVGVRRYQAVITSEAGARQVGADLGADLVIWGTYRGARVDARLTPIGARAGRSLLDASALTRLPEGNLEDIIEPLLFASGAVINQTLITKDQSNMAALVFTVIHEWPRSEDAAAFFPDDTAPAHMLRYYVLYPINKEAALHEVSEAIRQESTLPALFQLRAVLLSTLGQYDEAKEDIQTSLSLDPDFGSSITTLCLINIVQADYEAAVADCEYAHEIEGSWYSSTMLGMAYLYQNQLDEAFDMAKLSITGAPMSGYPYATMALAQMRMGQLDAGFTTLRQLLQQFPDSTAGSRLMTHFAEAMDQAQLYDALYPMVLGRYEDALAILEADTPIADSSMSALLSGFIYCVTGEDEASEAAYTRAIEDNDKLELAYLLRAEVRRNQGNILDAGADFLMAGQLSPGADFDALIELGMAGELSCKDYAFDTVIGE